MITGMLRNYLTIALMTLAVAVAGVALMIVSQRVYEEQQTLNRMDREALSAEWEIRSLKAELAYLTRPERLEEITTAMASLDGGTAKTNPVMMVSATTGLPDYSLSETLTLIPPRKPARSHVMKASAKVSLPTSAPMPTPAPVKTAQKKADFSSLLNTIGGGE